MRFTVQLLSVILFGIIVAFGYQYVAFYYGWFYTYRPMAYFEYDQNVFLVGTIFGCAPRTLWLLLRDCF